MLRVPDIQIIHEELSETLDRCAKENKKGELTSTLADVLIAIQTSNVLLLEILMELKGINPNQ